ncbi:hypothetical protein ACR79M_01545 [Sphingobacterium spiritivorum]|uniref:hypothetical protein n=1 Tax=Sphingobacterium TaxID=28453 RepID=UPI0025D4DBCD|nr:MULTISPECIES: hypothetical protein [unclassified Sphingobacterium]
MSNTVKLNKDTLRLIIDPLLFGAISFGLLILLTYLFRFDKNVTMECLAIATIIIVLRVSYLLDADSAKHFRQHYSQIHEKKLSNEKFNYHHEYYERPSFYFFLIFGTFVGAYGVFVLLEKYVFGFVLLIIGGGYIYHILKPQKSIKIAANGVWSTDFGFIYLNDIKKFEYYFSNGKFSSKHIKIYMQNPDLYKMKLPYLIVSMPNIEKENSLRSELSKLK